jgi:hypothetical protein
MATTWRLFIAQNYLAGSDLLGEPRLGQCAGMSPDDLRDCKQLITADQRIVCERLGTSPIDAPEGLKVGIGGRGGEGPVHGLRHPPEGDTTGWYIWRGELSDADDFFSPLHVSHLKTQLPEVVPYLALPPGWRFLLGPGHEDIWYDAALLDVGSSGQ